MDCSEYIDMISDEIDGELTEAKALFLMRHLVSCDGCRNEYSELLSLSETVRSSALHFPHPVPSGFSGKVIALIEEELVSTHQAARYIPEKRSVFGDFTDKIRALSFPAPSLSWSFAASLLLVASLTFYFKGTNNGLSPQQMMTDAKVIKARVLKQASMTASSGGSDLNYYVKKHANALRSKPVNYSIRYDDVVIVNNTPFEPGTLRNK